VDIVTALIHKTGISVKRRGEHTSVEVARSGRTSAVTVSVLVLAFAAFIGTHWLERQSVEQVVIKGATGLSRQYVQAVLGAEISKQRQNIVLAAVRDSIETIPFVTNAFVYYTGVRTIAAEIIECRPVAHVEIGDGNLRYVDDQGVILPESVERTAQDLPVIRPGAGQSYSELDLQGIVAILQAAQAQLGTELYSAVSEVVCRKNSRIELRTAHGVWYVNPTTGHGISRGISAGVSFQNARVFAHSFGAQALCNGVYDLRWDGQVVRQRGAS